MSLVVDVRHRVGEFDLAAAFVAPAGLTVVFGPSGAGKSLTLRLVAGLDRPQAGRVTLDDRLLSDAGAGLHLPVQQRRVGVVFQQSLLLPHRTVLGNVVLGVRAGGAVVRAGRRGERRAGAMAWLERVGAADLAARHPAGLSGGQQQRVALARALAGEPRLLLLDEPFNALDVPVRRQLRRLVRDIVEDAGIPALFVTHDPDERQALADHVVLARYGHVGEQPPQPEPVAS